jgi:predicted AAA+ superfamily ATPase
VGAQRGVLGLAEVRAGGGRGVALPLGLRDIVAAEGPRRAGKTFLTLKAAEKLLRSGGQALCISFNEPQLRKLDA